MMNEEQRMADQMTIAKTQDVVPDLEERLKALREPNFFRSSLGLIGDWTLIIATLWVIRMIHHPVAYLLGAYLMGIYQQRIGVMGHEAVHHVLSKNRRLNEWAGNLFCYWPIGISVLGYRRFHFMHHKYINTRFDPEWVGKELGAWNIPTTLNQMIFYAVKDLMGLSFKEMRVVFHLTHPPTLRSSIGPVLMSIAFIGLSVSTGNFWLPLVWYGGLYTSSWATHRMRIWFEHVGAMDTHRVRFPGWARWMISPHNIWVHWEHHKYSSIPYWNLLKVRALEPNEPVLEFGTLFRRFLGDSAVPLTQAAVKDSHGLERRA